MKAVFITLESNKNMDKNARWSVEGTLKKGVKNESLW